MDWSITGWKKVESDFQPINIWKKTLVIYRAQIAKAYIYLTKMLKRLSDIVLSAFILIITFPLIIAVACIIYLKMGCPVLFKQQRPGLNGKPFTFCKFRTMTRETDINGIVLPDRDRLTKLGKFIRKTSIDELPSLWNVFKGDMSLVGPRPLLMEYLDRYTMEQYRRHNVKPGITGWAQVNGRNTISWEKKFNLDVWYVDNQSHWLDMKILIITIWEVVKTEGISSTGHVTMDKFQGE